MDFRLTSLTILIVACCQTGLCAAASPPAVVVEVRASQDPPALALPIAADAAVLAAMHVKSEIVLTLPQALERALAGHPRLAAQQQEAFAAQARMYQGGLKPNPEIEAEISEFLGTAEMRFLRSATTGVGISQLIERGGKRCARIAVAESEGLVAEAELQQARLEIMQETAAAYLDALAAQARLEQARQLQALARQVYDLVGLRVAGGKSAQLELTRVELEQARAVLQGEQAQRELQAALSRLARLWGAEAAEFSAVAGELALPAQPPALAELEQLLPQAPEVRRWEAQEQLRLAQRDLACAQGVPDLTVSGGVERFEETDSFGLRLGVSIPWPVRDRNEGAVAEAQHYAAQARELRAAELRSKQQQLAAAHATLSSAFELANSIELTIIPAAEDAFELTQLGYQHGKFTLLDVLDAQRVLIEARTQQQEAVIDYHLAAVELERIVAQPLAGAGLQPAGSASAISTPDLATPTTGPQEHSNE